MSKKLDGKTAIITGCSGGIGRELALRFAQEGANLSICARSTDKLNATAVDCQKAGVRVLPITCDVTKPEDLHHLVDETVNEFGSVDILVNNAVNAKPGTPFEEQTEEDVMRVFESGFMATWRLMQYCLPNMKAHGGHIVNFGSPSGIVGTEGYAAYGAMKEAIRSLSRTAAREWGKYGITVNCVAPTAITPNMQAVIDTLPEGQRRPETLGFRIPPVGYLGNAYDDIAPVVVFLCSQDAKYLTGQTVRVDGGGTISAL